MATYQRSTKSFEPAVDPSTPPLKVFELALLKCLVTEIPVDAEYDSLSLTVSGGRVRIICAAKKVMLAEAAQQSIEKAVFSCDLLNLVSLEKMVVIRRTP